MKTIGLWHKDGIGSTENTNYKEVKVYRNNTLADTGGKWEVITITIK